MRFIMNTNVQWIQRTILNSLNLKRRRASLIKLCCLVFASMVVLRWYYSTSVGYQLKEVGPLMEQRYYTPSENVLIPLNHSFIMTNEHICQQDQPYMIGIVPSRMKNFRERRAIRKTYGSMSRGKVAFVNGVKIEHVVRFVFVVGKSNNDSIEKKISGENKQHRDMVQVDMVDSYYNLTLKVLMALKWVDTFCPNVKYVLKVDDDIFIHIGLLLSKIHSIKHSSYGNIFGFVHRAVIVLRNKSDKWALSKEEFPLNKYPNYTLGASYTMTRDIVPKIIQKAQYLPYLHNEDAFITGVVGGRIVGAHHDDLNRTSEWAWKSYNPCLLAVPCLFAERKEIYSYTMTPDQMYQTWRAIHENNIFCKLFRGRQLMLGQSNTAFAVRRRRTIFSRFV